MGYELKLMNAQTVAFISLVFSENVRSYASRSFDQPIWRNLCGNPDMHKAIVLAQVALYAAVLLPFFSEDILGLRGQHIGFWGWGVALIGPLATLVLCELCKIVTHFQMKQHQRRLSQGGDKAATWNMTSDMVMMARGDVAGVIGRTISGELAGAIGRTVSGDISTIVRMASGDSYSKVQEEVTV